MTKLNTTIEPRKLWEMEPTWLTFPGNAIMFPAIYTAHSQFGQTKYGIHADALRMRRDPDAEDFIQQFIDEKGRIHATSVGRPEVECLTVARLVAELQGLDARNINRDRIFTTCPLVSIGVAPYRYNVPPDREGYSLTLRKVRISLPHEFEK